MKAAQVKSFFERFAKKLRPPAARENLLANLGGIVPFRTDPSLDQASNATELWPRKGSANTRAGPQRRWGHEVFTL